MLNSMTFSVFRKAIVMVTILFATLPNSKANKTVTYANKDCSNSEINTFTSTSFNYGQGLADGTIDPVIPPPSPPGCYSTLPDASSNTDTSTSTSTLPSESTNLFPSGTPLQATIYSDDKCTRNEETLSFNYNQCTPNTKDGTSILAYYYPQDLNFEIRIFTDLKCNDFKSLYKILIADGKTCNVFETYDPAPTIIKYIIVPIDTTTNLTSPDLSTNIAFITSTGSISTGNDNTINSNTEGVDSSINITIQYKTGSQCQGNVDYTFTVESGECITGKTDSTKFTCHPDNTMLFVEYSDTVCKNIKETKNLIADGKTCNNLDQDLSIVASCGNSIDNNQAGSTGNSVNTPKNNDNVITMIATSTIPSGIISTATHIVYGPTGPSQFDSEVGFVTSSVNFPQGVSTTGINVISSTSSNIHVNNIIPAENTHKDNNNNANAVSIGNIVVIFIIINIIISF